jgi:hypothetical protein
LADTQEFTGVNTFNNAGGVVLTDGTNSSTLTTNSTGLKLSKGLTISATSGTNSTSLYTSPSINGELIVSGAMSLTGQLFTTSILGTGTITSTTFTSSTPQSYPLASSSNLATIQYVNTAISGGGDASLSAGTQSSPQTWSGYNYFSNGLDMNGTGTSLFTLGSTTNTTAGCNISTSSSVLTIKNILGSGGGVGGNDGFIFNSNGVPQMTTSYNKGLSIVSYLPTGDNNSRYGLILQSQTTSTPYTYFNVYMNGYNQLDGQSGGVWNTNYLQALPDTPSYMNYYSSKTYNTGSGENAPNTISPQYTWYVWNYSQGAYQERFHINAGGTQSFTNVASANSAQVAIGGSTIDSDGAGSMAITTYNASTTQAETQMTLSTGSFVLKDLINDLQITIGQAGLTTDNPNGITLGSTLNMNGNDITNCPSITNSGDINIDAGSDFVSLTGNKINLNTAGEPINLNSTYSDINMNASNGGIYITDTNMTIDFSPAGVADVGLILKSSNSSPIETTTLTSTAVAYSDSSTTTSTTWLDIITSANAGTPNLQQVLETGATATSSLTLNNNGIGNNFINLIPNATANNPQITLSDGTTTNTIDKNGYTTRNSVQNATHYINFSDNSATGTGAIQKTAGITCNPSTNTITATTFTGNLTGTASSATNATNVAITDDNTNATFYPVFVSNNTGNLPLKVDKTTNPLSYNPSTGSLQATTFSATTGGTIFSSLSNSTLTLQNVPTSTATMTASLLTIPQVSLSSTPSLVNDASRFGQVGLVYLSTSQFSVTGSASAQNFSVANIFNSTYSNYRIVINSATQVSFTAYPTYSLAGFLGTGVPTTGSLYGNELISSAPSSIGAVYTSGATLSSAPLIFAVSSLTNKQVVLEVENVGFANTSANVVGLKCKSFYGNPGVSGYSDRNIASTSLNGATITGLTIQQNSLGVGNNMTLQFIVYGYNLI